MVDWPTFSEDEILAVAKVLRSGQVNYWTGSEGRLFETEFAEYIGVKHAVAVSNGTVALELCLQALGIGEGDEVIVSSRTFVASASAIVGCGAIPVFADVDLDSQNITVETIQAKLTSRTKAIICVHLAGWPCDMPEIMKYARKNSLFVIEDCAQAHGACIDGRKVGSWGHMAAFSFCQDKIISTGGEGGMVVTDDKSLWQKAWSYKDHGKNYDSVYNKKHPPGFRWLHESFGSNGRMTEMQAAIGRIQLKKLDAWVLKRNHLAQMVADFFEKYSYFRVPNVPSHVLHAYYKFYLFVKPELLPEGLDRDSLMRQINASGVSCYTGSCSEIYREKCFAGLPASLPKKRLPNAKLLGETSLMFEVHPTLSEQNVRLNIQMIKRLLAEVLSNCTENY